MAVASDAWQHLVELAFPLRRIAPILEKSFPTRFLFVAALLPTAVDRRKRLLADRRDSDLGRLGSERGDASPVSDCIAVTPIILDPRGRCPSPKGVSRTTLEEASNSPNDGAAAAVALHS